jgi:hypothetical protein
LLSNDKLSSAGHGVRWIYGLSESFH